MRGLALDEVEEKIGRRVSTSARLVTGLAAAAAMLVLSASTGWSCVAMASLELTPFVVGPGQEVQFGGSYYHDAAPVVLHWGSLDGPVLATVAPDSLIDFGHGYRRTIAGRFTVPSDATAGAHVVLATQHGARGRPTWGVPARAVVQVGEPSPPAKRPPGESLVTLASLHLAHGRRGAPPAIALVGVASCVLTIVLVGTALRVRARRPRPQSG